MSERRRMAVALALAVVSLSLGATLASARTLSVSSTTFRLAWPEMRVTMPIAGGEASIQAICALTLAGTFHAGSFAKVAGALVATLSPTTLAPGPCRVGRGILLRETLPWHLRYESFSGTLPNISSVAFTVVGMNYAWAETLLPEFICLYAATTTSPARLTATVVRGSFTSVRWDETRQIPGGGQGGLCGSQATFSGSATMTEGRSAAVVTVTLI